MFQIRGSDGRAYRPGRDIAYVFPKAAQNAAYRLATRDGMGAIGPYAAHTGVTDTDLSEAAICLAKFVALTTNPALTSGQTGDFMAAWSDAGFDRLNKAALLILMFELGFGMTAAFFHAVREVSLPGQSAPGLNAIAESAARAANATKMDLPSARARRADEILSRDEDDGTGR